MTWIIGGLLLAGSAILGARQMMLLWLAGSRAKEKERRRVAEEIAEAKTHEAEIFAAPDRTDKQLDEVVRAHLKD